jgi:signal transduction histidine kinase
MSAARPPRVAWTLWAVNLVLLAVALVESILGGLPEGEAFFVAVIPLLVLTSSTVGALIASRQPRNVIGWLFLGAAMSWVMGAAASGIGELAADHGWAVGPIVRAADWLGAWAFYPGIFVPVTFLFLLFPDGHLPSRRWLPVALVSLTGIVGVTASVAFRPGPLEDAVLLRANPYAVGPAALWDAIAAASFLLTLAGLFGSVAALIVRFRRSSGAERLQLTWLGYAGVMVAVVFLLCGLGNTLFPGSALYNALTVLALLLIPAAAGIAILKYRLYDIDVVINKTLVFGALAAFITLVYVAVVVGLGRLVVSGDRPNLGLSIVATAVVAVAFQPVRVRVQHLANRMVYGVRATPYEVLMELARGVGAMESADDLLPRMARTLGEGTGVQAAAVWLRMGEDLRPVAAWPEDALSALSPVQLAGDALPDMPEAGSAAPILLDRDLLGAVSIRKPPGDPVTPAESRLLADLAAQAGPVVRNVRLTEELRRRMEEIERSRQRILTARDEERRRLERAIDGEVTRELASLAASVASALPLVSIDPREARRLIQAASDDGSRALDGLRDMARGIYPPLLADQGLAAALGAQARRTPLPVEVDSDGVGRYPEDVEAAVYFSVLEGLQNVAKYADASRAVIRLAATDGSLRFTVEDDGRGFDPSATGYGTGLQGMADRLAALNGDVTVASAPGSGTTVTGWVPARAPETVA